MVKILVSIKITIYNWAYETYSSAKLHVHNSLFEPKLALLVGLQIVSSKGEEEGALSDKFFGSLRQKIK